MAYNRPVAGSSPAAPTTWLVETGGGIFLALRYSAEEAEQCAREFLPRWPKGVRVVPPDPDGIAKFFI